MSGSFRIAQRMAKVDTSGIRKVFDLAAALENPINLSIGQPDFDVPDPVKDQAVTAIRQGLNKYTQTQGTAELRQAIAGQCRREFGWTDEPPVLITSGVSGGLLLAMLVLIDPGDEVILLDPYFVEYLHHVHLTGGVPVLIDTYPNFHPDVQKIADAITPKTRVIILNSPANPTGAVFTRQELTAIAEIARKHGILVISDEIYDAFVYDEPHVSLADIYEDTLLVRGFSKSHAMTGWRLGWATGPKNVIEKMTTLQQYTFVCAPSMVQSAGLVAMKTDISNHIAAYKRKRDMTQAALGESFGLVTPTGAFYAFVPAPKGQSATDFVAKAIANNVLLIPGSVFSQKDTHFRMCYTVDDETLAEGLDVLKRLA